MQIFNTSKISSDLLSFASIKFEENQEETYIPSILLNLVLSKFQGSKHGIVVLCRFCVLYFDDFNIFYQLWPMRNTVNGSRRDLFAEGRGGVHRMQLAKNQQQARNVNSRKSLRFQQRSVLDIIGACGLINRHLDISSGMSTQRGMGLMVHMYVEGRS